MEIYVAGEDLDLIKTNLPAYMKKNVFSIVEELAPTMAKLNPKETKN